LPTFSNLPMLVTDAFLPDIEVEKDMVEEAMFR
jgi:hypothetical protein